MVVGETERHVKAVDPTRGAVVEVRALMALIELEDVGVIFSQREQHSLELRAQNNDDPKVGPKEAVVLCLNEPRVGLRRFQFGLVVLGPGRLVSAPEKKTQGRARTSHA